MCRTDGHVADGRTYFGEVFQLNKLRQLRLLCIREFVFLSRLEYSSHWGWQSNPGPCAGSAMPLSQATVLGFRNSACIDSMATVLLAQTSKEAASAPIEELEKKNMARHRQRACVRREKAYNGPRIAALNRAFRCSVSRPLGPGLTTAEEAPRCCHRRRRARCCRRRRNDAVKNGQRPLGATLPGRRRLVQSE